GLLARESLSQVVYDWGCDKNCRVTAKDDTKRNSEGKAPEHVPSEYKQDDDYEQGRTGGDDRPAHRPVCCPVHDFGEGLCLEDRVVLPDSVENDDSIVYGIPHDRQEGRDDGLVDLKRE